MTEEQEKQESQKTLVAFVAGLLIGGLLVWVFGGNPDTKPVTEAVDNAAETVTEAGSEVAETANEAVDGVTETVSEIEVPTLQTGDGAVEVADQPASRLIKLDGATFPTSEGWIGVRSYPNEQIGSILGVAEFSESQGLVPTEIELLVPTIPGRTYAVTFFQDDGDSEFNPAYDFQLDTDITTFVAQ